MSGPLGELRRGGKAALARALASAEAAANDEATLALLDAAWAEPRAAVIGLTGPPGVGKSTLVSALVRAWRAQGRTVGVIAVDPSSRRTRGALLGDRTRIDVDPEDQGVFVRSLAARERLGGLADLAAAAMVLMRAVYDVVLVETVGVGQSETVVAGMVDLFLALMLPGAGDELQGIKKGLLEIADLIAVNKADGDNALRARQALAHYRAALRIIEPESPSWRPTVWTISGLTGAGLPELWAEIERHRAILGASGELAAKRRRQQVAWMWSMLDARLLSAFRDHPKIRALLPELKEAVAGGTVNPTAAVEQLLDVFNN